MTFHDVEVPQGPIAAFRRRNRIRRLAFFGSVLRQDFGPSSDIDVLIDFETGHCVGLLRLAELELELSELLGRRVDVSLSSCLSPYFRDEVLDEAKTVYVAA